MTSLANVNRKIAPPTTSNPVFRVSMLIGPYVLISISGHDSCFKHPAWQFADFGSRAFVTALASPSPTLEILSLLGPWSVGNRAERFPASASYE